MSQMGLTVKPIMGKYLSVEQNGIRAKKGHSYVFLTLRHHWKFTALIGG